MAFRAKAAFSKDCWATFSMHWSIFPEVSPTSTTSSIAWGNTLAASREFLKPSPLSRASKTAGTLAAKAAFPAASMEHSMPSLMPSPAFMQS